FDAIRKHGNMAAARTPPSGGNLGQPEAVQKLLDDTGFAASKIEMVRREWVLGNSGALLAALSRGTVRTAALIAAQAPAALPVIAAEIDRNMTPYRYEGGFAVPIAALLARGKKSS